MDKDKYGKNIRWLLYGAILVGGGLLIVGALELFLAKNTLGFAREALLGLASCLSLYGLYLKAGHDLEREKPSVGEEEKDQGI